MDPAEAWSSAKMRAWLIGGAAGMLGGLLSGGVGLFAGMCCLFQFANLLGPALTGLVAGLAGAGMAPWSSLEPGNNLGRGVGLGARAAIPAASLAAILGFLATMLWPVFWAGIQALNSGADFFEAAVAALVGLMAGAVMAVVFTGGGAFLGILLGLAGGAVMGAIR